MIYWIVYIFYMGTLLYLGLEFLHFVKGRVYEGDKRMGKRVRKVGSVF